VSPPARALAHAKVNLALVVGPATQGGKHELTTVFQRVELADEIELEPAAHTVVEGFADDTIVAAALDRLREASGAPHGWRVQIEKRIPVAGGLAGGSSDAAAALRLANATLAAPLAGEALRALASAVGADVPFFLADGPQLGEGDGGELTPLPALPQLFHVLLALPRGARKPSTAEVYRAFDARGGASGYASRRDELLAALRAARAPRDLAALPANDLASSPLAADLRALGAFRADVTGAGPTVFGLFEAEEAAASARDAVRARVDAVWLTRPAW